MQIYVVNPAPVITLSQRRHVSFWEALVGDTYSVFWLVFIAGYNSSTYVCLSVCLILASREILISFHFTCLLAERRLYTFYSLFNLWIMVIYTLLLSLASCEERAEIPSYHISEEGVVSYSVYV